MICDLFLYVLLATFVIFSNIKRGFLHLVLVIFVVCYQCYAVFLKRAFEQIKTYKYT